ncbi:MAG: glycosyltransferase [Saprospiraceae bacterium]|nr:glycosyltransferase [Saprospiraceae bacterium]
MNILITNIWLQNLGGTEVFVRDLAKALFDDGHHIEVYSPRTGMLANEIRSFGIHVTDNIQMLKTVPDIIHAHHFLPCMEVMNVFRKCPVVYFVHDYSFNGDIPPVSERITKYVAVDALCLEKLFQYEIPREKTEVLHNWVDISRFRHRDIFKNKPERALVFSNYAKPDNHYRIISSTCRDFGIDIDGIGMGFGNSIADPERILPHYDIIFAKGKSAMEAMASGAAVIVCDFRGLGGMVTSSNFEYFRKYNFGMKTMNKIIEPRTLLAELNNYDPLDCKAVTERIRREASFDLYIKQIEILYDELINKFTLNSASIDYSIEQAIFSTFDLSQKASKVHSDHLEHRIREMGLSLQDLNQKINGLEIEKRELLQGINARKRENQQLTEELNRYREMQVDLNKKRKSFWRKLFL